jgi:hypothetical protein
MAIPKYKEYFDLMLKQNEELFKTFRRIHDDFEEDPKKWKDNFNEIGRDVQDVLRVYENRLCGQSEGSGYSKYSTALAEKFQAEIKKHFPKINFIGLE